MRKSVQVAAVVSALVLSLMAIPQASAKQTVEVAFVHEREELNARLADLVAKRDAYIAEQRGKQHPKTSSFDQALAAKLKAQIG
jgi:hypothetical protein